MSFWIDVQYDPLRVLYVGILIFQGRVLKKGLGITSN
jgi:hypothetical protein